MNSTWRCSSGGVYVVQLTVEICGQYELHLTMYFWRSLCSSFQFSSVEEGIYELGNARMRSIPSLRSFPNVALETVPMFVWLTMALPRPFRKDRLALPLSTPLSSRRSIVWCPWLCVPCIYSHARWELPQYRSLGCCVCVTSFRALIISLVCSFCSV